ncbi:adhesion G protein-coupled receptor F5-like isoform X4 [Scleropages formosus]|uniref:adhesion G protein-coupled receptor F5-like isoform X4 n=1 Tax=Scleropages formosus TaxID=113540 RepID=UPI0010FA9B2E|nr:adhesion G protein-coupled receptor F5-like isoform X4 [Scleropages formosus]
MFVDPALSQTFNYFIAIEVNVSDISVVNQLRSLLNYVQFPYMISNTIEIDSANLTTVCSPNGTGYQCKCEDQLAWSYNTCLTYTSCGNDYNNYSCGCINGLPPDGESCGYIQPTIPPSPPSSATPTPTPSSPTTENSTETNSTTLSPPPSSPTPTPSFPTTENSTETNSTTLSPPPSSPTPTPSSPTTENSTEANSTTLSPPPSSPTPTPSSPTTENSTEANSTIPPPTPSSATPTPSPTTTEISTETTTPPTTSSAVTPKFQVEMSFKILDTFTTDLLDPTSVKYIKFKDDIQNALTANYQYLPGFLSVIVTGFRAGSVITDFVVNTNNVSDAAIVAANTQIVKDLKIKDYIIDPNSFQALINGTEPFSITPSPVLSGNVMQMNCSPPDAMSVQSVTWKFNNSPLPNSGRYTIINQPPTLVVLNVKTDDSGVYSCVVTDNILTYTHQQVITIQPQPPIINLPLSQIYVRCGNQNIPMKCCVTYSTPGTLQINWLDNSGNQLPSSSDVMLSINERCITYTLPVTQQNCANKKFTCQVMNGKINMTAVAQLNFLAAGALLTCNDPLYGNGTDGSVAVVGCPQNFEGNLTATCINKQWQVADNCVLSVIKQIATESENLTALMVPGIATQLANAVQSNRQQIQDSPATVSAVVNILNKIAEVSKNVTEDVIQNVLETVNILVSPNTTKTWSTLNNNNENKNTSARLLGSMETISGSLAQDYISINKENLNLQKTLFSRNFSTDLNSSHILIPDTGSPNVTAITTIVFTTMNIVLPARNSTETANTTNNTNVINGIVMLVKSDTIVKNVSISFNKQNTSLGNPQCVFWNFTLFGEAGGWDSSGCTVLDDKNDSITCSCNHLTSFSILMSPFIPEAIRILLDFITYIGVSISLLSLVLCLIIEAFVWTVVTKNSTAYMRHVSIVNIAVSLLMADIWFMVGAGISDIGHSTPVGSCTAATFFTHFFYLALFFWMLISALLLLYRMVMVFSDMSKCAMMSIAFTVGYGAPLIIAVITIAVTAPQHGYFRQDSACWLNWAQTKALLAFVIPALTIVAINLLILIVVLVKILMRGVGENRQPEEKNALVVVARCVVILTPLFGLTWGFGIGTMVAPESVGFHVVFAVLNSFQGLFILIFGTLLDSRVRAAIVGRFSFVHTLSGRTRTSSGGASSSSRFSRFRRERRNAYNVSDVAASSQSGASESFINI